MGIHGTFARIGTGNKVSDTFVLSELDASLYVLRQS